MLSLPKHLCYESKPNEMELLPRERCFDKLSMTPFLVR